MGYEALAVTNRGHEAIERYTSHEVAVSDILEMWPEDEQDVVIVDEETRETVVYMARGWKPNVCVLMENGQVSRIYSVVYDPVATPVKVIMSRIS